ncbi:flavin-containing monooxygenase [Solicola sp. PLA-1-18]|uniref:flavin-containing monooxygenase n=1 Tax=Solicola sp. PLA-1-18 TaxID=3380532 RepID=UPI003B7EBB7F
MSTSPEHRTDVVVVGAGQAGLSAAHHLARLGVDHVVLDANDSPGGAWQHRWRTLSMQDVHGVASLPGLAAPDSDPASAARDAVPAYFADYERRFDLDVRRPVKVSRVEDADGLLRVSTDHGTWTAPALVNATGTWERPFVPHFPGVETFAGRQVHTHDYDGPDDLAGLDVVVVGGGASAVQILGELAPVARTTWVTRRPPVWRGPGDFDTEAGREAVALVEERVRRGLPPQSVVSVTGLMLRPQEEQARLLGAYERHPMFATVEPHAVRWADGTSAPADVIVWATGFRPSVGHLAPLRLREATGGIRLVAREDAHTPTTAARDHRVQLVGYGPSASTIGANRAGRVAALAARRTVEASRELVA